MVCESVAESFVFFFELLDFEIGAGGVGSSIVEGDGAGVRDVNEAGAGEAGAEVLAWRSCRRANALSWAGGAFKFARRGFCQPVIHLRCIDAVSKIKNQKGEYTLHLIIPRSLWHNCRKGEIYLATIQSERLFARCVRSC